MEIMLIAAAAGLSAGVTWWANMRKATRRNRAGACGMCADPWTPERRSEAYLVQGRLVCAACAGRARARLLWAAGGLVALTAVPTYLMLGQGLVAALYPIVSASTLALLSVTLMKVANRRALAAPEGNDWRVLPVGEPGDPQ